MLIYLASPYSHPEENIRKLRYEAALLTQAFFNINLKAKFSVVYSPIAQHHPVATHFPLPYSFDFWAQKDFAMIAKSDEFWILPLTGWRDSFGLGEELEFAREKNKTVRFVSLLPPELVLASDPPESIPCHTFLESVKIIGAT